MRKRARDNDRLRERGDQHVEIQPWRPSHQRRRELWECKLNYTGRDSQVWTCRKTLHMGLFVCLCMCVCLCVCETYILRSKGVRKTKQKNRELKRMKTVWTVGSVEQQPLQAQCNRPILLSKVCNNMRKHLLRDKIVILLYMNQFKHLVESNYCWFLLFG